jgi:hypothetical protein
MTETGTIFILFAAFLLLKLPRRWAALPLLAGAAYMPLGQVVEIGPFSFTVIRILVAVGVIRVLVKREHLQGGTKKLDRMMILWGLCAVWSSLFHNDFGSSLVYRLGMLYDGLGVYLLFRVFVQGAEGMFLIARIVIIALIPVAIEMIYECATGTNAFSWLGGIDAESEVRDGRIRAQGPFSHAILAGTVGAVSWPLLLPLWKRNRKLAVLGLLVPVTMVMASRSSGPIMTCLVILIGLCAWKVKHNIHLIRWGALGAILALNILMEAPVYYLLARIDLTGSSTGWHRAELIHAALTHLDEWWFSGTDYTRHWIAYGVGWSKNHVDITNHYVKMGVIGGLPLLLAFVGVLICAFNSLGKVLRAGNGTCFEQQFMTWTLGAILLGHAATFLSISYFDQSMVFFLMLLACIGSQSQRRKAAAQALEPAVAVSSFEKWAGSPS